jgi:hypothetical protein
MAKTTAKTDNHNLSAKLELRRHFLCKYHSVGGIRVMDCCQGDGVIWSELRHEFKLASYWGLDVKPKKGRLKLDSVRVLQQPGWPQNVIDIDTYGSPWGHWEAMLPNIHQPTTVFLTIAQLGAAGGFVNCASQPIAAIGISKRIRDFCPSTILSRLQRLAMPYCLDQHRNHGLEIVEAVEAVTTGNARYVGIHLIPQQYQTATSE